MHHTALSLMKTVWRAIKYLKFRKDHETIMNKFPKFTHCRPLLSNFKILPLFSFYVLYNMNFSGSVKEIKGCIQQTTFVKTVILEIAIS